jgi:hypothetical protein
MLNCLQPTCEPSVPFAPSLPTLWRATIAQMHAHYRAKGLESRVAGYGYIEVRESEDDLWRKTGNEFHDCYVDDDNVMFFSSYRVLDVVNSFYRRGMPMVRKA